MKNRIIETIFDGWCEGEFGPKSKEEPEVQQTIDNLIRYFHASEKDKLYVEIQLMEAVCAREKNAFVQGFSLCLELLNGDLLQQE